MVFASITQEGNILRHFDLHGFLLSHIFIPYFLQNYHISDMRITLEIRTAFIFSFSKAVYVLSNEYFCVIVRMCSHILSLA